VEGVVHCSCLWEGRWNKL